jgi:hypothetical protein
MGRPFLQVLALRCGFQPDHHLQSVPALQHARRMHDRLAHIPVVLPVGRLLTMQIR